MPVQSNQESHLTSGKFALHKVNIATSREQRPWWRTWKDYPDPMLDAFLTLFGIAVVVIVLWLLL